MTVTKKPDHRGEYEVSRKTIACGNAGLAGEPRGDYARVLSIFCTRGCGCIVRPAFPTPSLSFGRMIDAQLGRIALRECGSVTHVRRPCLATRCCRCPSFETPAPAGSSG